MSTSFYQYRFCALCKINHKQKKKKHIYTQRHQQVLNNVLSKFSKKIKEARSGAEEQGTVGVHGVGWETGARVWCYFCQVEVDRHQTRQDCVVASAAFLTHLASQDHLQKMHAFFYEHLIQVEKKESFFITSQEIIRFMEKAETSAADFLQKKKGKLLQEKLKIQTAERRHQEVAWRGQQEELLKTSLVKKVGGLGTAMAGQSKSSGGDCTIPQGKKTMFAVGEGLSCVSLAQTQDGGGGNIYTGATPPWLMEDEEEGKGKEIGPTAETFSNHLKKLQKQKLPACRVGATFDHKVDTTAQWLPAFGRVWNNGRRLNSQRQFLKEWSSRRTSVHDRKPTLHRNGKSTPSPLTQTNQSYTKDHITGPWSRGGRRKTSQQTSVCSDGSKDLYNSTYSAGGCHRLQTSVGNSTSSGNGVGIETAHLSGLADNHGGIDSKSGCPSSIVSIYGGHSGLAVNCVGHSSLAANSGAHGGIAACYSSPGTSAYTHSVPGHESLPYFSSSSSSSTLYTYSPPPSSLNTHSEIVSSAKVECMSTWSFAPGVSDAGRGGTYTQWNNGDSTGKHPSASLPVNLPGAGMDQGISLPVNSTGNNNTGYYQSTSQNVSWQSSSNSPSDEVVLNSSQLGKHLQDISSHSEVYPSTIFGTSSQVANDNGQGEASILDGCQPYKRRRGANHTSASMNLGLIPIMPALLSRPVKKQPAMKNL